MTKFETDALILSQASALDNEINQTYFRNTSSQHPLGCDCGVCKFNRFDESYPQAENKYKTQNNWYQGN